MASYTDQIPQFNPYIKQLPVEAMAQVGMEKQRRYDEGIQKIQQSIDNIAGLDVYKDSDKKYLQSKLNDLGSNLKTVAAGDFSNYQLVNSVGGMAKQIGKDKNVQNAVSSTANIKKQQLAMEEAREKGTLTPENADYYQKKLNSYVSSDKPGELFTSQYTPYFDVFKHVKETFDALKPDGMTFDQVYVTGPDGKWKLDKSGNPIYSPVMIRKEEEGLFPQKVKEALDQAFSDGRVGQQLQISGEYAYKSVDSAGLIEKIKFQTQESLSTYTERLAELQLEKKLGKNVQEDIDKVEKTISQIENNISSYEEMAVNNPDALKGLLYQSAVKDRYSTMFSYRKTKTTTMDNPGWRANFDMMKEANEERRAANNLNFQKQKHYDDMNWKVLEYEQRDRLGKGKKVGASGETVEPGMGLSGGFEQADQPSTIDVIKAADLKYEEAANNFINKSDMFIYNTMLSGSTKNQDRYEKLINSGNSPDQAVKIMLDATAKANKESPEDLRTRWGKIAEVKINQMLATPNKVNNELKDSYGLYKQGKKEWDVQRSLKQELDRRTEAKLGGGVFKEISTADVGPQKIKLYDQEYDLSKSDVYDLAVYLKGHEGVLSGVGGLGTDSGVRKAGVAAKNRLEQKGLGDVVEALMRDQGPFTGGILTGMLRGAPNFFSAATYKDFYYGTISNKKGGTASHNVDWSQVEKIYNIIDKDQYTTGLKEKEAIIKSTYGIQPNLKAALLTGDAETDKATVFNLKRLGGAYTTGQEQNLSVDFDKFMTSLDVKDISDLNLEAQVIMDAFNRPQVEMITYDKAGKRSGGITISPEEAMNNFNIDVNKLYEPGEVSSLRNILKMYGNQTTKSNIADRQTYINGDAYLEKDDFPKMTNSPYDIKANIRESNGLYYGYVYVGDPSNPDNSKVTTTPGVASLTELYTNMKQNFTPAWAQVILNQR
jgi:hypothetical protein